MRMFYHSLAALWHHRRVFVASLILVPLLLVLHGLSKPASYTASATLDVDTTRATTPLLRNIHNEQHEELLYRILTNQRLVEDTLNETGQLLTEQTTEEQAFITRDFINRLDLNILSDNFLEITLSGDMPEGMTSQLETLIFNFIYELLAPERFRTDQQLVGLEEKIKHYRTQVRQSQTALSMLEQEAGDTPDEKQTRAIVTAEFNLQRASAQLELVQNEYEQLLASANRFQPDRANVLPTGLIWFAEAPRVDVNQLEAYQIRARVWYGLIGGFFLGLGMVILARLSDRSLRNDDEIMRSLGLTVLGRLPNLGPVQIDHGHVVVDAQIIQRSS